MGNVKRLVLAAAALGAPALASACPTCFNVSPEARLAYLGTTGLLSLLPLGFVAGVVVYVRSRIRAAQEPSP